MIRLLFLSIALTLSGCLTVGGHIGYIDPESGITAGITLGSGPSGKTTKLPSTKGLKK